MPVDLWQPPPAGKITKAAEAIPVWLTVRVPYSEQAFTAAGLVIAWGAGRVQVVWSPAPGEVITGWHPAVDVQRIVRAGAGQSPGE